MQSICVVTPRTCRSHANDELREANRSARLSALRDIAPMQRQDPVCVCCMWRLSYGHINSYVCQCYPAALPTSAPACALSCMQIPVQLSNASASLSVLQALRAHAPPDHRGADDWTCPRCRFDNKPNRATCRECKAKKPDAVRKDQVLSCKLRHLCCQHAVSSPQHRSTAVVGV